MTIQGSKFSALAEQQKHDTRDALKGHKTYRAELNAVYSSKNGGSLTIGTKYVIYNVAAGDDFSNVGFTAEWSVFTATGTTPTNWSNATRVLVITGYAVNGLVLENSIGDVAFSFDEDSVSGYLIYINVPSEYYMETSCTSASAYTLVGVNNKNIEFSSYDGSDTFAAKMIVEIRLYPIASIMLLNPNLQ